MTAAQVEALGRALAGKRVTPQQIQAEWMRWGDGKPMNTAFAEALAEELNPSSDILPPIAVASVILTAEKMRLAQLERQLAYTAAVSFLESESVPDVWLDLNAALQGEFADTIEDALDYLHLLGAVVFHAERENVVRVLELEALPSSHQAVS